MVDAAASAVKLRRTRLLARIPSQGWLKLGYGGLQILLLTALSINSLFFYAIWRGWTRRFTDPSVMGLQIAAAGLLALRMGYFLAVEAMVITTALFFTAFFFGVFNFVTLELLHLMILLVVLLMSLLGSYIGGLRKRLAQQKHALAAALTRLNELASRDELTGLYDRRHLMEVLAQQQERARRHHEPFAVCILDLDHFKRINDEHGHGVGDQVLREFSDRIRAQLRRKDVVGHGDSDSTFG